MLAEYFFRKLIFSRRAGSLIRRIAWLSVVGIAISITAFLVVLFVMNGMNQSIRQRILALEPHVSVELKSTLSGSLKMEDLPIYKRLSENPQWKVHIFESQDVILRSLEGQFRGVEARGMTQEGFKFFLSELNRLEKEKYAFDPKLSDLWDENFIPEAGQIVLGIDLAKGLNVFEGDMLTIVPPETLLLPPGESPRFEQVRVAKILSTNLADLDSQMAYYIKDKTLLNLRSGASRHLGYDVWLPNGYDAGSVKDSLLTFNDMEILTWMDRNSALFWALKLEKAVIGAFLGIAGLIASFSILTVMALLISQKRRDLAILKTLGLSSKASVKLMTFVGFLLGGAGILVGTFLGTGISLWLQYKPVRGLLPDIYYDQQIPSLVDWWLVFIVLVLSILIIGIGAYWPSRTLSSLDPSHVLRQKN